MNVGDSQAVAIVETEEQKLLKVEAPLVAVFTRAGVSTATIARLYDAGVKTTAIFCNVASSADTMRDFLVGGVKMNVTDYAGDFLEVAKILGAWEDAKLLRSTVSRRQAEQRADAQVPQIQLEVYEEARELFQATEYEIEDTQAPSKAYLERKLDEAAGTFRAEPLTTVTTAAQEDANVTIEPKVDPNGVFRVSKKSFVIGYPKDSEALRLRLRTMCYCLCMVKQHSPNRSVLHSVSVHVFDRYIDWLFGPKVWGLAIRDLHGKPLSTPTIDQVMAYDFAIRKAVAKKMNRGIDFATALGEAQGDTELKHTEFLAQVSISAGSAQSRAISAPGLAGSAASGAQSSKDDKKRRTEDDGNKEQGKKRKNRGARLREQLRTARENAAQPSGGQPNDRNGTPKGGGKNGKGGGKGGKGLPSNARTTTTVGDKPICFNWNKNRPCNRSPCRFEHVCCICESKDHRGCDHQS